MTLLKEYRIYYGERHDKSPDACGIIVEAKNEKDARRIFKEKMNTSFRKWKIFIVEEVK